ncbi:XRE family transcriptional regulator [Pseudomonas linyingensis]|nr:S24 family peptidase [Pseudomonas linyingensis]
METIGSRIAAAREKKRMNQSELGRLLGVSPQSVQAWESDRNTPRPKRMSEIAMALGVSMSSLLEGSRGPREASQPTERSVAEPDGTGTASSAAELVRTMLATKAGKALSQEARARLIVAAQEEAEQAPAKHSGNVLTGNFNLSARVVEGDILIPQYDVRASMGHGQMPAEYAEFVRNVVVSGPQLEKLGLEFTSPANLSIITGWGQSMEGTINDKDPVIVDRGVNEFAGDGIYVLTWNDMLYIKRLQMADADNFELISDNQKHKDRTVPIGDVTIHARVLFVWNGKKL